MLFHDNATEINYDRAFPFDVIRYREVDQFTHRQIRIIVDTVWITLPFHSLTKPSSRENYREMVKNYVLNLIKSYQSSYFIRVPRNRNDLHYEERYSHIHTTPSVVIKTMDALDDNGWIDLHMGYFDKQREKGKQTRIFPSQKFIDFVDRKIGLRGSKKILFVKEDPKETIQLRHKIDKKKFRLIPYNDTPKTIVMRERLKIINDFNRGVLTILPLTREELVEMKPEHKETINNMLLNGSLIPYNQPIHLDQNIPVSTSTSNTYHTSTITTTTAHSTTTDQHHRIEKEKERTGREHIPITKTLAQINEQYQPPNFKISYSNNYRDKAYSSIEEVLKDSPESDRFWFRIFHSKMFRAFSDTSKCFNHHGRFYGDPVQNLPKWMRGKIIMEGKEVEECDYCSLHPTMLYTMVGTTPPENIYLIDKRSDPQLRKEYKAVLLVSINHKDPETLWSAVSLHFREELGYQAGDQRLTKRYIMGIYERLLEHNKPIAKYMNTGVALRLMRKDSEIANRIMYEFVTRGIPIRCIHDSFIVPAEYEHDLKVLMVQYFKEVMDTDYEIGITTERVMKNNPKKAPDAPVFDVEKAEGELVEVDHVACKGDSENNDLLDDNLKYFEEFITDGSGVDVEMPRGKFSKRPERFESRFEGIRI